MKNLFVVLSLSLLFASISYADIKKDQKILFPDEPNGHTSYHFGRAVAINGDYAAIGAYNASAVYVYKRNFTTKLFEKIAKLTVDDPTLRFGFSVDISGDRIIASSLDTDCPDGDRCGGAYIFDKPDTGWEDMTQTIKLIPFDLQAGDGFGHSVALNGNTAVVGAPYEDENGDLAGAAYIFEKSGGAAWDSGTKFFSPYSSNPTLNYYGDSVAIDKDNTVVVGAYGRDWNAYVYVKEGQWILKTELVASRSFGYSVAIDEGTIIVGATRGKCADGSEGCGAAFIYEKPGNGWPKAVYEPSLIKLNSTNKTEDNFGYQVALDGDQAIVSHCGDSEQFCSVYLFEKPPGGWSDMTQSDRFSVRTSNAANRFGYSIDIDNGTVLAGTPGDRCEKDTDPECGSAFMFDLKPQGMPTSLLMYLLD